MDRCTSYWLYQKYENRGGQGFVPAFDPLFVYSIDGDGTMPIRVKSEMDAACGCIERWVDSLGYICGDCEVGYQFRWVNCNPSTYTYYGDYKYDILCEQISEDGVTWSATTNTKLSTQAVGVADKKIKLTFDNGDVFGQSCGTDDGVWHSYPTNDDVIALELPQHTTNLYDNVIGDYTTTTLWGLNEVSAMSFSDCVFEIGTRYRWDFGNGAINRKRSIYDTDVAESGGAIDHFYCNNGYFGVFPISAVTGWDIRQLSLPNTVKWIGGRVFSANKIKSLTLPSSVETIGFVRGFDRYTVGASEWDRTASGTFALNKSLKTVNLNEGLKSIGSYDFMGCALLDKIELPSTLEKIGDDVFSACTNMKQIIFKSSTPPSMLPDATWPVGFDLSAMDDVTVYVPCGSKTDYETYFPSISGSVEEYGGACGNVPSIESTYRVVATYKVGNNTYYERHGKITSDSYFNATTQFFENCTEAYGYADEIILGEYIYPTSGDSGTNHVEINGARKLTIEADSYELVGLTTNAEELEIKNSLDYRICFGYYSDHDGTPHIIDETHNLKTITIDSGYTPTFYGCFKSLTELSAVTINGNPSLYYDTFAFCQNLQDVYINYSGGVISAYTSTQHSDYIPFYGCNPNMRVHVPCSLYDLYRTHPFWGALNIVRDSDDCQSSGYVTISSNTFSTDCYTSIFSFDGNPVYCSSTAGDEMVLQCKGINYLSFENVVCGEYGRVNYLEFYKDGTLVYSYQCSSTKGGVAGFIETYTMENLNDDSEHIISIKSIHSGNGRSNYFTYTYG